MPELNHFPFPSLSDPVSRHIQSLLPQDLLCPNCLDPSADPSSVPPRITAATPLTGLPVLLVILEPSFQHVGAAIVTLVKCSHVISLLRTPSGFVFSDRHAALLIKPCLPPGP